ncbi:VENN motif pre-toxin domain-containing protein [Burkholderia ubonensis]|uniref:VENN motif pre-toxin domain-containing protein n=1 Tax=Burkholderia ubonensis TaxID=101571 RepID=UPI0009B43504|nr:VENN motif pre-toxin domain-containing protein [Burkholderia ubonensis]
MSAAFSPDVVKAIDPTGAPLDAGQQAALAAFATLAGGGLAGLAGQNAMAGATAAQNEALNNTGDHAADAVKKGGLLSAVGTWLQNTYGDPIGSFKNWGNQFVGLMQASNGQTPPSDPNPLVQASNGNPPATGGAVVTPPVVACSPGAGCVVTSPIASPGATGSPSNATAVERQQRPRFRQRHERSRCHKHIGRCRAACGAKSRDVSGQHRQWLNIRREGRCTWARLYRY